ncbi:MAG: hypothetical protein R3E96_03620 [Planctomycetota bacterium]
MPTHMVRISLLALLACVPLACSSSTANPTDLPLRRGSIELHEAGSLKKGFLTKPVEMRGLKLSRWVQLYPDGSLHGGHLVADADLAGVKIPADSHVWFDPEGHLDFAWFSKPVNFGQVTVAGGPVSKIETRFYPDGTLKTAFLRADQVVQGVPCKASPRTR